MVFSEIFSTSFLFTIGIIIILIGGIFAYFNYKMAEQDHKLNSMLGLITTLAGETQFFRSKINMLQQVSVHKHGNEGENVINDDNKEELINVSDEEDDDDDDDDSSEYDTESNSSDETYDSDESEETKVNGDSITLLNLSLGNDELLNGIVTNNMDSLEDLYSNSDQTIKTVHLETPIELSNKELTQDEELNNIDSLALTQDPSFFKNIIINDVGDNEDVEENEKNEKMEDYKKMSINKLREIVVSSGLVTDASKLKKNDIIKIMENSVTH
jgi:hypothetical protein